MAQFTVFKRPSRWVVYPLLAAVVALVAVGLYGNFASTAVCSRCGAMREMVEWQIPATFITLFRHSMIHATPVSEALMSSGLVPPHEHSWLFCHGGGNGVLCALGEGRHILPLMQSKNVAAILGASQQFKEQTFRDQLLQALFDPKTAAAVRSLEMSVPPNGFADAKSFHAWLALEKEGFLENIAVSREETEAKIQP